MAKKLSKAKDRGMGGGKIKVKENSASQLSGMKKSKYMWRLEHWYDAHARGAAAAQRIAYFTFCLGARR